MPFAITYRKLMTTGFTQAMSKVAQYPGYKSTKQAYDVGKVIRLLQQEIEVAQDLWSKKVEQYAEKDEDGQVLCPEGQPPGSFKIPDDKEEEFQQVFEEFHDTEITVETHALPLSMLDGVGLTPGELMLIDDVLTDDTPSRGPGIPEKVAPARPAAVQ